MVIIAGIDYLTRSERPNMAAILHCAATRAPGVTVASISEGLREEFKARSENLSEIATVVPAAQDEDDIGLEDRISTRSEKPPDDEIEEQSNRPLEGLLRSISRFIRSIRQYVN